MSSIKEALYQHLISQAAVTVLAGSRVYPDILPQEPALPAVTYIRRGVERSKTFCGTESLARSSFQLDTWAKTYAEAEELAQAVRAALTDFVGTMGGSPGVYVSDVALENDFDLSDLEPGLFRVSMDFLVSHAETL